MDKLVNIAQQKAQEYLNKDDDNNNKPQQSQQQHQQQQGYGNKPHPTLSRTAQLPRHPTLSR